MNLMSGGLDWCGVNEREEHQPDQTSFYGLPTIDPVRHPRLQLVSRRRLTPVVATHPLPVGQQTKVFTHSRA